MCKPFNYCFAMERLGLEKVHQHVGQEPSGRQFDDLTLLARTAIGDLQGEHAKDNPNGKLILFMDLNNFYRTHEQK